MINWSLIKPGDIIIRTGIPLSDGDYSQYTKILILENGAGQFLNNPWYNRAPINVSSARLGEISSTIKDWISPNDWDLFIKSGEEQKSRIGNIE